MFGVGEVLEGEDGVEVGEGRIRVFTEREWESSLFVQGKHFISCSSRDVKENEYFIALTDIGGINLEKVLGFVRDKVNIKVAGRVLGSIKDNLELTFGKEGNSKALVLEFLQGIKEDGDAVVHGSYCFV